MSAGPPRTPGAAGSSGPCSREHYLSPELFARERERIFCREWFCVGREEEVAAAGDYVVKEVAGESILVVRTRDGGLAAHYNVCRHRGSQLVPAGHAGCFAGGIRCPYHSWTYTLEGELRTAPFLVGGVRRPRSGGDLHLHPVGVDVWGGFLFVQPDARRGVRTRPHARRPARRGARPAPALSAGASCAWPAGSSTRSRPTGRSCSRTTTSATTAARCTRSSAGWFPRSGSAAAPSSTGSGGFPHRDGAWTFTASGTTNRLPFEGLERRRAHPPQGRADLSQLHAEPERRARGGVLPASRTGPTGPPSSTSSCSTPTRWPSRTSIRPTRWTSGTW